MCSVDWALVVNLIAALGSCGAAIAAVSIALASRRERQSERLSAAKAQAMLVLLDVRLADGWPGFAVYVLNIGSMPILNAGVDSARFKPVPTAGFKVVNRHGPILKSVEPHDDKRSLIIEFLDDQGDSVISGHKDRLNVLVIDNAKPDDLDVTIRFMDAHGNHWLRTRDTVELTKTVAKQPHIGKH